MQSSGKISITPAAPIFQWWDFVPHYTMKDCWDKKALELDLSEVRAVYRRGPIFLLHCHREGVDYLVYLAQIPEGLTPMPVTVLGPLEAVKLLRKFPSKWKRMFPSQ